MGRLRCEAIGGGAVRSWEDVVDILASLASWRLQCDEATACCLKKHGLVGKSPQECISICTVYREAYFREWQVQYQIDRQVNNSSHILEQELAAGITPDHPFF